MGNARTPLVLLLQGAGYGQQAPLLWWSKAIAEQHGCETVAPAWSVDEQAAADPVPFVERAIRVTLGERRPDLVVAKSFGCFALPWAVRNHVRGLWLTPVLTERAVALALADAPEDHLAIGGDADQMWRPDLAPGTRAQVRTVAGADHLLQVSSDWRRAQSLQAEVFDTVEDVVRQVGATV